MGSCFCHTRITNSLSHPLYMATLTFKKKKGRLSAILGQMKDSSHKKPVKALHFPFKSFLDDGGQERVECLLGAVISWLELCEVSAVRSYRIGRERKFA